MTVLEVFLPFTNVLGTVGVEERTRAMFQALPPLAVVSVILEKRIKWSKNIKDCLIKLGNCFTHTLAYLAVYSIMKGELFVQSDYARKEERKQ